uniref:Uncharacterized protein n=1 Tax=Knipowitschia caucasica TaxID=637954 RepID=A0AAV2LJX7_KNICA
MPRKKKGGQSPARVPSGLQLEGGDHTGSRPPMANSFLPGSAAQENILKMLRMLFWSYLLQLLIHNLFPYLRLVLRGPLQHYLRNLHHKQISQHI